MSTATTQITLRTAVLIPFVMIFLLAISVMVYVQKQNYETVVTDISDKQLSVLTESVHEHLNCFLNEPLAAVTTLAHSVNHHNLFHPIDSHEIQTYLLSTFETLSESIPQLDVIAFGSESGDFTGFRLEPSGNYTLMLQSQQTGGDLVIYETSLVSDDIRSVITSYDPRNRPWYQPVATNQRPMWSEIYSNSDERQEITLSAMAPVYLKQELAGVLVADVRLNTFNKFLREIAQKTKASVFIMDQEHRLVAHSESGSVISWGTRFSDKGQRLLASESTNPIIQSSATRVRSFDLFHTTQTFTFVFDHNGQRIFSRLTPYEDPNGIKWFIGTSISEAELLGVLPNSQEKSWLVGIIVSLIGIAICWVIFNRITKPINTTAAAALQLAKGDWNSSLPKPGYVYETTVLVQAFNEMTANLKASFTALREQLVYDSLTRLYSRQGLVEMCTQQRCQCQGTLFLLGINRFRDINDSVGHHNGDQLLIDIAERLKQQFQDDTLLARIGGDEFAIFVSNVHNSNDVRLIERRLQQLFATPFITQEEAVIMKISLGIVQSKQGEDMSLWLRNASIALSYAKQDSLTNVCHYSPELASASKFRTQMLTKIQTGVENREFIPHYQPIIDLATGNTCGAEALARWQSESGMVSPLDFIPIAEESGMIKAIGQQILLQACRDTYNAIENKQWPSDFQLHVNISVNQISCPDFVDSVTRVLTITKLPASNLTLEITESRIIDSGPTTLDNMKKLRDMGIGIAIDDFGTGYSSLGYLHTLPFTCLKIDRTFVNQLSQENLERSVVAAVLNITAGLKTSVVAEGVENASQAQLLRSIGCHQVQGFYYSRPMPLEEWPTHLVNME
ncbi:GGDEF and EAL domain-containing protein [Vibrio natriegens]|uniref:Diguanylate cyclase n=1 Tax=Vibrio natriegens NBRC 15636 = ATCC 14048 = DSM 759 TaxID=1219067 RepID=A0AAN1CUG6_VIBNA|nr:GGDEF and EAL domain-containing protein [Vibrio natriegens]ALR16802.1 diguanylate cyclase [Vibrio natriegens NBRC 15636 = ATCC 14048 = DSM 759]ANQ11332.1 diguanylate cyclase [Vibrio natriegens NBRC 15636 = ATCC 14048 = DSM 759]EPM38542.1 diguanylate cyclase [Vibrio natriegens NBRC 15636 = ATCC 14048 = DSM 759]MDX6025656.1 EAL domain-containing protein [Vibrio natriegens NBRC 15636 = ATCC 14048 = DSM 759]UUI11776.1 EAL domain-containing protein [Vibrio natriegens]